MTDKSRVICSITAFTVLAFFMTIEYFPADLILQIYIAVTSEIAIYELIGLAPLMLFFSVKEHDFGYVLLLIILMSGQVLFVNVYADTYQIETSPETQKPVENNRVFYEPWALKIKFRSDKHMSLS